MPGRMVRGGQGLIRRRKAKKPGTCDMCGRPIAAGELIVSVGGSPWRHNRHVSLGLGR
jgi:hypothetical protein